MIILTIRADKEEAEIGIFDNYAELAYYKWQAHRQLAETIHIEIAKLLQKLGKNLTDIDGIVAYKGPGSFTGLRIGLAVANALAYSLERPIVAATGDDWVKQTTARLKNSESDHIALPEYGAPVHTSKPTR